MKKALAALFLLCGALTAQAAEPLTWEAAVALAIKNNPDLLAAQQSLLARKAQRSESYNTLMPRIGLDTRYVDSPGHPRDSRWQAGASASMDILNAGDIATVKSAYAGVDQADANLKLSASNILFDLKRAFANLLFAQEQVDVATRIRDIRVRNSELVTLRYASGRESKGNMMRAKAELLESNADVAQAQRDVKAAEHEFNRQLGNDGFGTVVATGTFNTANLPPEPDDFLSLVNSHPSVLLQQASVSLSEADLKQARSVLWPALSANYARSFRDDEFFPKNPTWSASGILNLPVFGGGPTSAYYSVSSAKRNLEKSELDLRSVRNQVHSNLQTGWAAFAGAKEEVEVQSAFLDAARQRNGEADVRYSSGLMSYENWEQIVTDRVNFERSLVRAQRDGVIAEAQWENALGKGLGE